MGEVTKIAVTLWARPEHGGGKKWQKGGLGAVARGSLISLEAALSGHKVKDVSYTMVSRETCMCQSCCAVLFVVFRAWVKLRCFAEAAVCYGAEAKLLPLSGVACHGHSHG